MRKRHILMLALVTGLGFSPVYGGEMQSILNSIERSTDTVLQNIGREANRANSEFLNSVNNQGAEEQIRAHRALEENRIKELAAASGAEPAEIRQMRQDGATWQQIASKYNINLSGLPAFQN